MRPPGTPPEAVWSPASVPLAGALGGEFFGTFVLVFFGVGAVNAAVVTGAQTGLWQVAVVWAVGVSLGIYTAGALSGAHINPAITAAAAVWDGFPWRRVVPYWIAQTLGAAAASVVLYGMFFADSGSRGQWLVRPRSLPLRRLLRDRTSHRRPAHPHERRCRDALMAKAGHLSILNCA